MAKSKGGGATSIGDDTATGEPASGPKGPYITDEDDGTSLPNTNGPKNDRPKSNPSHADRKPPSKT